MIYRIIIFLFFSSMLSGLDFPVRLSQELSFGYDNNFLRYSNYELNDHFNIDDYVDLKYGKMGDSQFFDSGIIKPTFKIQLSPHLINGKKTNLSLKGSFSEYTSSNSKSYFSILGMFEMKLASYSWLKLSYFLIPKYYLRPYLDRDIYSDELFPCFFSNEVVSVSYSKSLPIKRTWFRLKFSQGYQYYNTHFTEFDSEISSLEFSLNTKYYRSYYLSLVLGYSNSDNISYRHELIPESTKINRSYIKNGFKFTVRKELKKLFFDELGLKFQYDIRDYDLDSWYYNADNWKFYYDYDITAHILKKVSKNVSFKLSYRLFNRDVTSSGTDEIVWVEDSKSFSRNEFWLKFYFNYPVMR